MGKTRRTLPHLCISGDNRKGSSRMRSARLKGVAAFLLAYWIKWLGQMEVKLIIWHVARGGKMKKKNLWNFFLSVHLTHLTFIWHWVIFRQDMFICFCHQWFSVSSRFRKTDLIYTVSFGQSPPAHLPSERKTSPLVNPQWHQSVIRI